MRLVSATSRSLLARGHRQGGRALVASSASLIVLAFAAAAQAQSASAAGPDAVGLGEVVVTAERTVSTAQKTPISITVVSDEQLQSRGVNNVSLLQNIEPTFVLTTGQNGALSSSIRGVTSSGSTQFGGSAVAINTDGQYYFSLFNGLLYDIDRVEILKGPQGTLYGLNSTAGAVNLITTAPKFRNSVDVNAEYGNYNYWRVDGALNWAATETLAFRLSAVRAMRDGFREHPGLPASDRLHETGVRLSGLWKPLDKLSIRLTGEYTRDNNGNASNQGVILTASPATPAGLPPSNVTYQSLGANPYSWRLSHNGYNFTNSYIARANVSYDLGLATFTYIGSFDHAEYAHCIEPFGTATFTTVQCPWVQLPLSKGFYETTEHEARLNGETNFGTKWQVGGFFAHYLQSTYNDTYNTSSTRFAAPVTVPTSHFHQPHNAETSKALYGQVSQALSSQLTLTGGLRYTHVYQIAKDNYTDALNTTVFNASSGRTVQYTRTFNNAEDNYNNTSWHLGLDYQLTPTNLLYASAGTSFKDGGFTQFNTFAPETIRAYEIGTKNRFLENRLQLNAAAWYYDYTNQQATVFQLGPDGVAHQTTVNAGSSNLKGVEASAVWRVDVDDTLSASATYANGKYTQFSIIQSIIPLGSTNSITANLVGNKPPNDPAWTLTAGWDRTWAKFNTMTLSTSINTRYVTSYFLTIYNEAGDKVKPYMQTDASVTLGGINRRWDLSLWVRNLENNATLNFASFVVNGPFSIYEFGWAAPRTYGVRLNTHF